MRARGGPDLDVLAVNARLQRARKALREAHRALLVLAQLDGDAEHGSYDHRVLADGARRVRLRLWGALLETGGGKPEGDG